MQILWGECISGALYNEDFKRLAREAGFADPRILSSSRIDVTDAELAQIVGNAKFTSITYRLFKLPDHLESLCEDYGQIATYKVHLQIVDSQEQLLNVLLTLVYLILLHFKAESHYCCAHFHIHTCTPGSIILMLLTVMYTL